MLNPKTLKIAGAGIVVSALAIGLGIGLGGNRNVKNKDMSASEARGYNQCRRLIDGRYASPTNDEFVRNGERSALRDLQWGNDGHGQSTYAAGGGGSKGSSGGSKGGSKSGRSDSKSVHSKGSSASKGGFKHGRSKSGSKGNYVSGGGSKGSYSYCSKGSAKGSSYNPCEPVQYVPCSCAEADSKGRYYGSSKGWHSDGHRELEWGSDGHSGMFSGGGTKSSPGAYKGTSSYSGESKGAHKASSYSGESKGWDHGGHSSVYSKSSVSKSVSGGFKGASYSGGSKGWNHDGHSNGFSKSKSNSSYAGGSKGWNHDGHYISGYSKSGGSKSSSSVYKGASYSGGSNYSKSSWNKGTSPYSGGRTKGYYFKPVYGGSKGSQLKGSSANTCYCAVSGSNDGVGKGHYTVNSGQCTCLAPSGSKGSKLNGNKGSQLVPVPCPCVSPPAPLAPSICEPVPRPTPKPVTYLSPAPTACDEQRFFFINGVCTNDMFLLGGTAYISAVECCNVYYGTGSLYDGNCLYVDTCNTYFYTYTNPPSSGSTPTVSTEVTGPPTLPDRRSGGTT